MDELFIGPIILPTRSSSDHIMQEYLHFLRKKFVRFRKNTYLCNRKPQKQRGKHSVWCPDGGIGRRVGLKHQCRKACRFDPGSGYLSKQFKISQVADIKALARFFILQQPSVCSTFAPQVYPYIFPRCLPDSYVSSQLLPSWSIWTFLHYEKQDWSLYMVTATWMFVPQMIKYVKSQLWKVEYKN